MQWVFQDYEAFGYVASAGSSYSSQLPNGFAFKDGDDFARAYYCKNGLFWKWEWAYVLEWVGAESPNRAAGLSSGIDGFIALDGWYSTDFSTTAHMDTNGVICDYPVQILVGNEKEVITPEYIFD